jgi:predicted molibdopterin-dependent oxidoreductase YjgC
MARPAWQVIGVFLAGLQDQQAPARPADAFRALGDLTPEFAGISFDELGVNGKPLRGAEEATGPTR